MESLLESYRKYRWFFTSSGKLVVGGKSAEQNDSLLQKIKYIKKDFVVMHTSSPGSPFCVILAEIGKVNKSDIKECALFTACFGKAWKAGKKKESVYIFTSSQLYKNKSMKQGTWGVLGKSKEIAVSLSLVLIKQKSVLRAVPESSVKDKESILLKIVPGNADKASQINTIYRMLNNRFSHEEILSALPAGGIKIIK